MRLSLGPAGRWLLASSTGFLAVGVLAGLPVVTALGVFSLGALVWAGAAGRVASESVRRGDLSAVLGDGTGEHRTRVGRVLTLPLTLRGAAASRLTEVRLEAGMVTPATAVVVVEGDDFAVRITTPAVGHAWVQGFHMQALVAGGLLVLRGWLPCRGRVSVLPRTFPMRGDPPLRATRAASQDRASMGRSRRRGFGLEIRELRDHQPGDPFKHVAWAATARRGKLVTREFESNLMLSTWLLVDVSPSMYWGEPGRARIDFALETAWNLASQLLARGDRVGLSLHDERVRLDIPPSSARGHLFRILEGLQEAHHLPHEDRTEVTERELVASVASWFETQQGRSFRLPERFLREAGPRQSEHDEARLSEAVEAQLAGQLERGRPGRFLIGADAYARDRRQSRYRAFCRHMGIGLPLDPTPRPGGQAHGLEQAIEHVLRARGGPHTLVVISDLSTADDLAALRRAAMGARRHRHGVLVLCPSDPAFEGAVQPGDGPLAEALVEVQRIRTRHSLAAVEAVLRPAGVIVVPVNSREGVPRILQRLDHVA